VDLQPRVDRRAERRLGASVAPFVHLGEEAAQDSLGVPLVARRLGQVFALFVTGSTLA
jgi:hypothetical protein